jgi:hypothetical protein
VFCVAFGRSISSLEFLLPRAFLGFACGAKPGAQGNAGSC